MENYIDAEDYYYQALKIFTENDIKLGIAEIESNLGLMFRKKGAFDVSLSHLNEAISIYEDNMESMTVSENKFIMSPYINAIETCGIINSQLKQYDIAIKFFENTLFLKEKYLGKGAVISALINLGVTYSEIDIDKSMDYYLQALAALDKKSPIYLKIVILNNLGGCLEDKGELDHALNYYLDAIKLMDESGQRHYEAPIHKHIGTIYFKKGLYDKALPEIQKCMDISSKSGEKNEIQDCYLVLSDIYMAQKEFQIALDFRIKYDKLKDEIYKKDLSVQLVDLQKKYDTTSAIANNLKLEKSLITEELKKIMKTGFAGVSDSIKEVRRLAVEASLHKDIKVLITGESGVGKEIVARLIHYSDSIKQGRFIDVNCSAIPFSMAESEFFGYAKGAFTGAIDSKSGYFEEANNGSLFLDEIGDMPMNLQSKLLRVLETKEIRRLGSTKSIPVQFRLISATNKDIGELINENLFRSDLMYRINTLEINIPPLRERPEDIQPLLEYYISEFSRKMNKVLPQYDKEIIGCLSKYHFPGNIRELKNMIEKAMIFMKNDHLVAKDFSMQMQVHNTFAQEQGELPCFNLLQMEDKLLLQSLAECEGNQTQAAKKMGISYSTFKRRYKKLREIKINN